MKYKREIGLGILILMALLCFAYLAYKIGKIGRYGETIQVYAVFDDAAGIVKGSEIKMAGVNVGNVNSIAVESGKAKMEFELKKTLKLKKDAKALIRAKSILGEKYIAILDGSSGALLANKDTITDTFTPIDIEGLVVKLGGLADSINPDDIKSLVEFLKSFTAQDGTDVKQTLTKLTDTLTAIQDVAIKAKVVLKQVEDKDPLITRLLKNINELSEKELRGVLEKLDRTLTNISESNIDKNAGEVVAKMNKILDEIPADMKSIRDAATMLNEILSNLKGFDKAKVDELNKDLKKFLKEEGIKVRMF